MFDPCFIRFLLLLTAGSNQAPKAHLILTGIEGGALIQERGEKWPQGLPEVAI